MHRCKHIWEHICIYAGVTEYMHAYVGIYTHLLISSQICICASISGGNYVRVLACLCIDASIDGSICIFAGTTAYMHSCVYVGLYAYTLISDIFFFFRVQRNGNTNRGVESDRMNIHMLGHTLNSEF